MSNRIVAMHSVMYNTKTNLFNTYTSGSGVGANTIANRRAKLSRAHLNKGTMQNPKTGKKISAVTPLKNKEHPLHKKSKSMFQRIKDKLSTELPYAYETGKIVTRNNMINMERIKCLDLDILSIEYLVA